MVNSGPNGTSLAAWSWWLRLVVPISDRHRNRQAAAGMNAGECADGELLIVVVEVFFLARPQRKQPPAF